MHLPELSPMQLYGTAALTASFAAAAAAASSPDAGLACGASDDAFAVVDFDTAVLSLILWKSGIAFFSSERCRPGPLPLSVGIIVAFIPVSALPRLRRPPG